MRLAKNHLCVLQQLPFWRQAPGNGLVFANASDGLAFTIPQHIPTPGVDLGADLPKSLFTITKGLIEQRLWLVMLSSAGSGHVGTYLLPALVARGHEVVNVSRGTSSPYREQCGVEGCRASWRGPQG